MHSSTKMRSRQVAEFCISEKCPERHLLRLVDRHISLASVREKLRDSYSEITARRSIRNCCCAFCWSDICIGLPASASWSKNFICIWRGAGSQRLVSIRRFHITPPSRRTGTVVSLNRVCSRSSLRKSYPDISASAPVTPYDMRSLVEDWRKRLL